MSILLVILFPFFVFAGDPTVLEGKWVQGCRAGTSREETFSVDSVSLEEKTFEDSLCSVPSSEIISSGNFVLGKAVQFPHEAKEIDFSFVKVEVVLYTQSAVDRFNHTMMCGFYDWRLNQRKDVTGLSCSFYGSVLIKVPQAGEFRYGVYRQVDNRLFFGQMSAEYDSKTPDKRPRVFNPYAYIRAQ